MQATATSLGHGTPADGRTDVRVSMSNHDNHRREEQKRTETGPRFESANPGAGCNATHVARGRRKWKRITAQEDRQRAKRQLDPERS